MKKKLLMAAIGAALVAGPMVTAQAAPTLYGKLHMSFDRDENGGTGSSKIERGFFSSNSSRFGIKGDEDLGNGMKAIYQMETRIRADNAADAAFQTGAARTSFLGMSSGAGSVRVGIINSPIKEMGRAVDLFDERVGDSRNIYNTYDNVTATAPTTGATTAGANNAVEGNFLRNALRYDTPDMGGLKISAIYSAAEGTIPASVSSGATTGRVFGLTGTYSSGPIMAALGYGKADGSTLTNKDESEWRGVLKFDFGPGDVRLFYSKQKDIAGNNVGNTAAGGVFTNASMDRKVWGLGTSFKITGNDVLKAQYYKADAMGGVKDTGGNELALGYDHIFSKTTLVYLAYAKTSNDSKTFAFKPAGAGHGDNLLTAADGKGGKAISVGMETLF